MKEVQEVRPLEKSENSDTEVTSSLVLPSGSSTPTSSLLSPYHFPNSPFQAHISYFRQFCQNLKSHTKFKNLFHFVNMSKSGPLHCQKPNTKYYKTFF